jgi:glycosyltransferase involved in cell wall biosynthesis
MAAEKVLDVSVVVPLFNEEESLRAVHWEVTKAMEPLRERSYEIVFVDDGSTDGSFDVCSDLYEKDPEHVRVIRLRRNFGQTAAMAAGFDAACGGIIIPMDADLQNDPADIPRLIAKIEEGYDVVSGWRSDRKDAFWLRRLPSAAANSLISWITGVWLHDYGCTLKAYDRTVAEHIAFYGEMHRFLPALASWAGARVAEIKVNHRPRQFGKSKYGLGRVLRVFLDLITIKFLLSYSTQPMQVFGKWGLLALLMGFLSGILTAVLKFFPPHKDVTGNPWMYICIFFCLGGLQLIGMGLLGEINVRTYYESQKKSIYTIREARGPKRKP